MREKNLLHKTLLTWHRITKSMMQLSNLRVKLRIQLILNVSTTGLITDEFQHKIASNLTITQDQLIIRLIP